MTPTTRGRIGVVLRVGVTVALLAYLVSTVDLASLRGQFRGMDPAWVGVALLFQFLGIAASTRVWQRLLSPLDGAEESFPALFRLYLTSRFFNLVGPGTVVGDASRAYATRDGRDVAAPVAAVVAEKGLSVAALVVVAGVAGLLVETPPATFAVLRTAGVAALVAGVVALVALRLLRSTADSGVLGRIARHVDAVVAAYADHPVTVGRATVAAVGVVAATVLSVWALVTALGVAVPFLYLWAVVPLVAVAVALPVSVQGIGVREGAYVLFFGFVGVAPEAAVAVGLANFALSLAVAGTGGLLYLNVSREVRPT